MSAGSRLRAGMLAMALMFGAIGGVAMTPEEIEQAMSLENQPKITHVLEKQAEKEEN